MKKFFKVPNFIYNYHLSPSAFYVYIYLSNTFYWKKSVRIKLKTIAKNCDMCTNTVISALGELEQCKLIQKIHHKHFQSGFKTTNEYIIRRVNSKFAKIDPNVFKFLKSSKTSALLYCAVCYYQNSHNQAFPSYAQLQNITGLSKTTCINKVTEMSGNGLLCKEHYICLAGDFGHNNYTTLSMRLRVFLFSVIFKNYGRFIVLFECYEFEKTVKISGGVYKEKFQKIRYTCVIFCEKARRKAMDFFKHKRGCTNFAHPIIDPHKLRLKTEN